MNITTNKFSEAVFDLIKPFCKGETELNRINISLTDKNSVLFEILENLPIDLEMLNNLVNLRNVDVSDSIYFKNSAHISYYLTKQNHSVSENGIRLAPIYLNGKVYSDNITMYTSIVKNKLNIHFNIDFTNISDLLYIVPYVSILSKEYLRVLNTKNIMEDYSSDPLIYGSLSFFIYSLKSDNQSLLNQICSSQLHSVELNDVPSYILNDNFQPNYNDDLKIYFDVKKYIQ